MGPFKDVPANHVNANAIAYVKAEGIVEGYADGTYKPDATINRAEFVKILAASSYSAEEIYDCPLHGDMGTVFSDVSGDTWYISYLCTARSHDVIIGYPDGTFRPGDAVSFVEAAKIITASYSIGEPALNCSGPDGYEICAGHAAMGDIWYTRHITALADRHAIPVTVSSPYHEVTRGEMAEMIWRLKAGITDLPSNEYGDITGGEAHPLATYQDIGYSIAFPAKWFIEADAVFDTDAPDDGSEGVIISEESFASRNLDASTSVRITVMDTCPELPRMRYNGGYDLDINGKTWTYTAGSEGAAGSVQAMGVYSYRKDTSHCYVVTTNDFRSTGEAYDEPMRSQVKYDNAQMDLILREIVRMIAVE